MKKDFQIFSSFGAADSDLIIRAMIWNDQNMAFEKISFEKKRLERIYEINEEHAGLQLKTGERIETLLSLEDLEKRIYRPNPRDPMLFDLTDKTGEAYKSVTQIKFMFSVRKPESDQVRFYVLFEKDIVWPSLEERDGRNGTFIYIHLQNGVKGPFGEAEKILVDMPKATLTKYYAETRANRRNVLDLSQHSTTKAPRPANILPPPSPGR